MFGFNARLLDVKRGRNYIEEGNMKKDCIYSFLVLLMGFIIVGCNCGGEVGNIGGDAEANDVVVKSCANSAQCPSGYVCENKQCVKPDGGITCRNKADCPTGMDCINGICKEISDVEEVSDVEGIGDTGVVSSGKIEVIPDKLDFGAAIWGVDVVRELRIRNIGKGVLRINEIRFSPETNPDTNNPRYRYEVVGGKAVPFDIDEGGEESVNVIYRQDDATPDKGYLEIISSDSNQPTIDVYLYSHYKDKPDLNIVDRSKVPEEVLYPKAGDVAKYGINVGDAEVGGEVKKVVSIKNNSTEGILEIKESTLVNLSKNGYEVRYIDTVDSNKEYKAPIYISGGGMVDIEIRYAPREVEFNEKGRLTIKTNDGDINNDGISDDGVLEIEISGRSGYKAMDIEVTPNGLSFGEVEVGTEARSDVKICNVGGDDLVIDNSSGLVGMGGGYRIEPDRIGGVISAGGCKSVDVIFAPQALGVKEDKLIIRSNDPDESIVEVKLYGVGTDPNIMVVPSYIDLGQVKIGEVSNISEIAITNSGLGSLRIEGIGLSAGSTNEFELVNLPNSYPVELRGWGVDMLKIGVRYRPNGEGKDSGAVEIKSSDNDNKVVYVNLSGEGIKGCTPSCVNKECGDDGCGGSCGVCGDNSTCLNNKCICNSGYANCNNDLSDGCEVNLNSINSCGTNCSNKVVCLSTNGTNPVCDNGICKLTCNSGYADCNSGVGSSDGCEVNLNNPLTCGTGCGNITNCGQNSDCLLGVCECKSGYGNCDGLWSNGCEKNLTNDANNCGSCGNSCGANGICTNSQCECISPYLNCNGLLSDGCEVNKNTDVNNCGGCNNVCNLPNTAVNSCVSGSCKVVSCVNGYGNCNGIDSDGCEKNLTNDANNCGSCGNSCGTNATCSNSNCVCNIGYGNCDDNWSNGCESNLSSDPNHCGSCISSCGQNSICVSAQCGCNSGYGNCDGSWSNGCESNLTSDPNHCGSCISNCGQNSICVNAQCGCNSGYGNCDGFWSNGCEVNLNSDSSNCGVCGNNCGANSVCNSGSCGCIVGHYDCNGSLSDGCEKQGDIRHLWSKRFGGNYYDYGQSVSVDSSGNVYITGYFRSSTIDFGGGALTNAGVTDIYLAKFDNNGNHKWSKSLGGSGSDLGYSVSVDSSGNVYITGYFSSSTIDFGGGALTNAGGTDIYLAKFDNNGNHKWSKRFGGSINDLGSSVSVDSSGNVYITGWFASSTIDFGGGALTNAGGSCDSYPCYDIFLAKFDSNGNHKWSKRFGGSGDDWGYSISVDSSGNVYITGYFSSSTIDFGGGALTNAGYSDIFLAKFDSDGNHQWSKRFGGNYYDYGQSVSVDSSGNVYITGYFGSSTIDFGGGALTNAGSTDIYLTKFDSNGNHKWSKRFGGSSIDRGNSVSVDSSGNVYITGYFGSSTIDFGGGALTNAGSYDIFLARFDSNGNHIWSKSFGGIGNDYGYSVSVDSSGNVYGTGSFSGSNVDFGGCPLSSTGDYDIYLIKYAP
jgi:hypothetical protein